MMNIHFLQQLHQFWFTLQFLEGFNGGLSPGWILEHQIRACLKLVFLL